LESFEDSELLVERYPIPKSGPYARPIDHASRATARSST